MTEAKNVDILPMAAVGLILVLITMMAAPLVTSHTRTEIVVPQTHSSEKKVEEEIAICLTRDGRLLFNDDEVPDLEEVEYQVEMALARDPYLLVIVRADKEVLHSQVLDILATIKRAGALRIACATKRVSES